MTRATTKACVVVRDMVVQSPPVLPPPPVAVTPAELIESWPDDLKHQWEERAAIMEHDGRLERSVAERRAFDDMQNQMWNGPRRYPHGGT